jgi:hypothetical protein
MKSILPCAALLVAVAVIGPGLPQSASAASPPATAPLAIEPPTPPKSLFTFDPKTSKDPFFPKTSRFATLVVKTNEIELPPAPLFPEDIRFQGVSGTPAKPFAIVNNKTVEKGERFELILKGQRVRVQCVDIKDKSVTLEINGITKELKLRTALQ